MDDLADLTCRVCLNVEELMVSIYEAVEDMQSNLSQLLEQCGGLKVTRFDNFPKYLCKECTSELLIAAKFREKCSKTQQMLENLIQVELETIPQTDLHCGEKTEGNSKIYGKEKDLEMPASDPKIDSAISVEEFFVQDIENTDFITEFVGDQETNIVAELKDNFFDANYENVHMDTELLSDIEKITVEQSIENEVDNFSDLIIFDEDDGNDQTDSSFANQIFNFPTPELGYCCDICGAAFHYALNLTKHFLTHSCETLYTCRTCNYPFSKEIDYAKHTKNCSEKLPIIQNNLNHHSPLKETIKIEDQSLQKKFCDEQMLGKKKVNRNKEKKCHVCTYCQKEFKAMFGLETHIRIHTGDRPFPCPECDKTFKTQHSKQLHLKRHSGPGDLKCAVCGKVFYERCNLKVHMRIHTGEKPHKCATCGHRFSRVFSLKLHQRTHTGEKPYKCQYCDRAFAQKCDLTAHIRIHTGLRPYRCPICFKGCIKSSALTKHMQLKHSIFNLPVESQLNEPKMESEEEFI